ncbi:hypothetical protein B0F90DRAFT_1827404 [Multifurca ochricompacta]|uniref:CCHC-type domain-containing protein n=1 Tax=Multifurca ochricompacta TaxID=376703 RepID=A0AAD4LSP1_9AGAM|nr:hypothetical protein B0F90DRAFT_1827404 [Multifurca ochricompacta]
MSDQAAMKPTGLLFDPSIDFWSSHQRQDPHICSKTSATQAEQTIVLPWSDLPRRKDRVGLLLVGLPSGPPPGGPPPGGPPPPPGPLPPPPGGPPPDKGVCGTKRLGTSQRQDWSVDTGPSNRGREHLARALQANARIASDAEEGCHWSWEGVQKEIEWKSWCRESGQGTRRRLLAIQTVIQTVDKEKKSKENKLSHAPPEYGLGPWRENPPAIVTDSEPEEYIEESSEDAQVIATSFTAQTVAPESTTSRTSALVSPQITQQTSDTPTIIYPKMSTIAAQLPDPAPVSKKFMLEFETFKNFNHDVLQIIEWLNNRVTAGIRTTDEDLWDVVVQRFKDAFTDGQAKQKAARELKSLKMERGDLDGYGLPNPLVKNIIQFHHPESWSQWTSAARTQQQDYLDFQTQFGVDTKKDPNTMDTSADHTKAHAALTNDEKKNLMKEGRCFHCRAQGHMSRFCPKKTVRAAEATVAAATTTPPVQNLPTPVKENPVTAPKTKEQKAAAIWEHMMNEDEAVRALIIDKAFGQKDF